MESTYPNVVNSWLPGAAGWLLGIHPICFVANKLEAPSGPVATLLPSVGSMGWSDSLERRFDISNSLKYRQLQWVMVGGCGTFDAK